MIRALSILLLWCLFSAPGWSAILVDMSYGQSISGSFNLGNSLPLKQQNYGLSLDYIGDMKAGLLKIGNEKFSLGGGLYTGQVTYSAGSTQTTGGNFFLTLRTGWLVLLRNKTWMIQLTPEFILLSRLAAASYSQTTIDEENFQSASLSSFAGNGSIRLPVYLGKKINWKLGKAELYLGGSLCLLMQNFSSKVDTVVATSPSTGKVTKIEKSSEGSFQLQAISLQMHVTFLM